MKLNDYIAVSGWNFELVVQDDGNDVFYQCRGVEGFINIISNWDAAVKLGEILAKDGLDVDVNHSEKGLVEVTINNYKIFR
jgi:hypothetical protein